MCFVETVNHRGNGRIYPDLEVESPYTIPGMKRWKLASRNAAGSGFRP